MGGERYRVLFQQLGDLGFERERGIKGITLGILMILKSYKDRKKLELLAKLTGSDEGFGDYALEEGVVGRALHLEAIRSLLLLMEWAHAAGEGVTEEEVIDGVMELGVACMWMGDRVCDELGGLARLSEARPLCVD